MSLRYDHAPLANVERLPDGRLRVKATFSRVGDLNYLRADGTLQVERLTEEELFRADSLETAGLAPVTLNHPPEGMVTPKNWKKYAVGASGSTVKANRADGLVEVVFVVGDEDAIAAIEEGKAREVSAGYSTLVEQRSDGKFYQTDRKYNHLALVERGRAGPSVCLHLDSAEDWAVMAPDDSAPADDDQPQNNSDGGCETCMAKYKGFEMDEGGIEAFKKMEADMAAMKEDMKGMVPKKDSADSIAQKKLDALAGENAGLLTRIASLEADLGTRMDASAVESAAVARLDAYTECLPFLPEGVKFDAALPPGEWYKAAVAAANPHIDLADKSADFVNGMFSTMATVTASTEAKADAAKAADFRRVLDSAVTAGHSGKAGEDHIEAADRQDAEDRDAINNLFAFGGAN